MKTLYVGLGGLGGRVVCRIKKSFADNDADNLYVVLDNDGNDLKNKFLGSVPCIDLYCHKQVRHLIEEYSSLGIRDWLPDSPAFLYTCAGNVSGSRVLGRLTFFDAMETNRLEPLEFILRKAALDGDKCIRVVIVASLVGGTGSGAFLQTALWIRQLLQYDYNVSAEILGFLVGPEIFLKAFPDRCRQPSVYVPICANTSAALKELAMLDGVIAAETFSKTIDLDGLLLRSFKMKTPVYDRIALFGMDHFSGENAASYDLLVENLAHSALRMSNYQSIGGDRLIAVSQNFQKAYDQEMAPARQGNKYCMTPHLDKRWGDLK